MQNLVSISNKANLAQQLSKAHFSAIFNQFASKSNPNFNSSTLLDLKPELIIQEEAKIVEDNYTSIQAQEDSQIESTDDNEVLDPNQEQNYLNLALYDTPINFKESSAISKIIDEAIKQNENFQLIDDLKDQAKKTIYNQLKYFVKKTLNLLGEYKKPLLIGAAGAVAVAGIYKIIENIVEQKQLDEIKTLRVENQLIKQQIRGLSTILKKKNADLIQIKQQKTQTESQNKSRIEKLEQQLEILLKQFNPEKTQNNQ